MEFSGKTVIITGAGSGIGFATAKRFYENGASVALVDVNEQALLEAAKEMPNALLLKTDVRNFQEVELAVKKTVETFHGVDVMVNCAGGNSARVFGEPMDFCDRPMEHILWGLEVNLHGTMYFCHEAMRYMKEKGSGVIINLGSITGEEGDPIGSDYAIAKSAIMTGFLKSLAQLGAKYGIRACCVSPGPVLTRPAMAKMRTLVGRAAETEEIVDMIHYLASEKAAFITGVNYFVDGGRSVLQRPFGYD